MKQLQKCPFCGNTEFSPYNLQSVQLVEQEKNKTGFGLHAEPYKVYFVKCFRCFAMGGAGTTGDNALTGTTIDEDTARQIAIDKWNRRAG